jgi:hypothetical protein
MSSNAGPSTIYLIRHGEKLGEPGNEKDGGPHLSVRGSARAAAIPQLFTPESAESGSQGNVPSCALAGQGVAFEGSYVEESVAASVGPRFTPPDVIFATSPGSNTNVDENNSGGDTTNATSHRPLETIIPLATALNLAPNTNYTDSDKDIAKLVSEVTGGDCAGKVVLIAWHHGKLTALAQALGATDAPAWPGPVFDWLWEIDYSENPRHVIQHWQGLLYGDHAPV